MLLRKLQKKMKNTMNWQYTRSMYRIESIWYHVLRLHSFGSLS